MLDEPDTKVKDIILETSEGKRLTPNEITTYKKNLESKIWRTYSTVMFPLKDIETGESYIKKDTEWIRVWLITSDKKAYFHFDFSDLKEYGT